MMANAFLNRQQVVQAAAQHAKICSRSRKCRYTHKAQLKMWPEMVVWHGPVAVTWDYCLATLGSYVSHWVTNCHKCLGACLVSAAACICIGVMLCWKLENLKG